VQVPAGLTVPPLPKQPRRHCAESGEILPATATMAVMTPALPLTGAQYEIAADGYRAVVTELGAGLRDLRHDDRPLIAAYQADELPPGAAGQLLLPWSNRIDGGRYTIAGSEYQLDLSEPAAGNAIHGLTRWSAWSLARREAGVVVLRQDLLGRTGYPFRLDLEVEYRLGSEAGLTVSVTARNTGSRPAPYGTGSHPYLTAGAPAVDGCELTLPVSRWLPADPRGIPSGPPGDVAGTPFDFRAARPVGTVTLDHAFTGLERDEAGLAWARLTGDGAGAALWAGPGYRWLQVFTADTLGPAQRRRAMAIEPMTCPPNAFVTGTDLLILEPGETVTHRWGIQATGGAG
jgi:aldose 1-epimerase